MRFSKSTFWFGLVILISVFMAFLNHRLYITDYPSYLHAWSQSDHFGITLGFLNNNFNFFLPETPVLNHQFPDQWLSATTHGITSVDFPIHHYIPALLMKLYGENTPAISRLYTLCYSLFGLWAIYKLTFLLSGNRIKSLFVLIFAATSPVFIFYQASFLPTIPSLANSFLGLYFYAKYIKEGKNRLFVYTILFLTLSALSRTTFVIPLIAVFGNEFLRVLFKETKIKNKILPFLLSVCAILGYFFYNQYIRETYSSIFIGDIVLDKSVSEFWKSITTFIQRWFFHYFTGYHYITLILIAIGSIFYKIKNNKNKTTISWLSIYLCILMVGYLMFQVAMIRAFLEHDYYLLDTWYTPIVFFLILGISVISIPSSKMLLRSLGGIMMVLSILFISRSYSSQKHRHFLPDYDMPTRSLYNFMGSSEYLDHLNISKTAKILSLDPYAPNLPFVVMERRGYCVIYADKKKIDKALTFDYDFIVIQTRLYESTIHQYYPDLINRLEIVGSNGRITVCKLLQESRKQSVDEFLKKKNNQILFSYKQDFEGEIKESHYKNLKLNSEIFTSGTNSSETHPQSKYGMLFKEIIPEFCLKRSTEIEIKGNIFSRLNEDAHFVLAVSDGKDNVYYTSVLLKEIYNLENKEHWQTFEISKILPKFNSENYYISFYIYNPDGGHLFIDDLEINMF